MIRIADVTEDADGTEAFHALVEDVYADQPPNVKPARRQVEHNLQRPAFSEAQRLFVAFEGDLAVGRVVAGLAPRLRHAEANSYGLLGFFEALDRPRAVAQLLRRAAQWLRPHTAGPIIGPMDGDSWHRYRVNAGPFARPPFPLEPWNPPYYAKLWEAEGTGFSILETYSSKWVQDVAAVLPHLESAAHGCEQLGFTIRGLDADHVSDELRLVYRLSSEIFREAFLYSPISEHDFMALYHGIERLLDPELLLFATSAEGREVGFLFAFADPVQRAVHYKTIGVLRESRRAGVAAALAHRAYSNALRRGWPQANHALMRDDNASQAFDAGLGEVFRRYRLYGWTAA